MLCLFQIACNGSYLFLTLYVDDILIVAKSRVEILNLKTLLSKKFDIKDLGAATKIRAMEINRDRQTGKLFVS